MSLIQRFNDLSIKIKLSVFFSLLIGMMTVYIYLLVPMWFEKMAIGVTDAKEASYVDLFRQNLQTPLQYNESDELQAYINALNLNEDVVYIVITSPSGKMLASVNLDLAETVKYRVSGKADGGWLDYPIRRAQTTITRNGRKIGIVYFAISLASISEELVRIRMAVGLMSIMMFLVGLMAVYSLSGFVTRPLNEMVQTVNQIAGGQIDQRAAVHSRDEIGFLASSFNQMVDKLHVAQQELEKSQASLEQRVEERTNELTREIKERQQAEVRVSESKQKLQFVMDNIPQAVIWKDTALKVVGCNSNFLGLVDYDSPEDIIGMTNQDLAWLPGFSERLDEMEHQVIESAKVVYEVIGPVKKPNGQNVWLDTRKAPMHGAEGQVIGLLGTYHDITERIHIESELQQSREQFRMLSTRLQTIREEERTRIAREVHDELGQTLTALKIDLFWLAGKLEDRDQPIVERMETISRTVESTIKTVQRISTELRPGILDDLGLHAALEWQANQFQTRTGVDCEITCGSTEWPLKRDLTTAVFRIFQEALTNVARHANASRVESHLTYTDGRLLLTIQDDGVGITPDQLENPRSLGLIGMKERVHIWGGDVTFVGAENEGTTVQVDVPLTS